MSTSTKFNNKFENEKNDRTERACLIQDQVKVVLNSERLSGKDSDVSPESALIVCRACTAGNT